MRSYGLVVLLLLLGVMTQPVLGASWPVVLVTPPNNSPAVWGDYVQGSGLLGVLRNHGYSMGENLFLLDSDSPAHSDPLLAAEALDQLIHSIRAKRDETPVNLVGYSVGGLTVAHYLQRFAQEGDVDTAVLVSAPLGGSFLATYYRRQWEGLRQEALARGGFPYLAIPLIPAAPDRGLPPFTSESDYIQQRALQTYAPLYGQYVLQSRWLNLPGWSPTSTSFEAYLYQHHQSFFSDNLLQAVSPPLGYSEQTASAGHDLSRSFYELMALDSGRRLYLIERTGLVDLAAEVFGDGYLPVDPHDALRHYTVRLAQILGGRLLKANQAPLLAQLLSWLGDRLGFGPQEAPLRRLQQVRVPIPSVTQVDGSIGHLQVPVNYQLSLWQKWRRQGGGPRLVALTSQVNNWLKPLMPALGRNDLVVEVASALPAPGPHDVFRVWSGIIRPDHFGLLSRKDVQTYIVGQLSQPSGVTRSHWPLAARTVAKTWSWQEGGRINTSTWRPSYINIGPERLQGLAGELHLQLQLPQLPEGAHWLLTYGDQREQLAGLTSYRFSLGLFQHHPLQVSLRPVLPPDGTWEREMDFAVNYQVQFLALHEPMYPHATPPPTMSDPIRVVLRSKRTTQRHEDRTYHQRWLWDMGDGTVLEEDNPASARLQVEHVYHHPGTYQVQAVSYDNHGQLLRHLSWIQRVENGPMSVAFSAYSIIEPDVEVRLSGPVSWITGRPASFTVEVDVGELPHTRREVVSVDPGVRFEVFWERPGYFTVEAAATVRTTYEFPEGPLTITNSYIGRTTVRVLAPVLVE